MLDPVGGATLWKQTIQGPCLTRRGCVSLDLGWDAEIHVVFLTTPPICDVYGSTQILTLRNLTGELDCGAAAIMG